ncbi:Acyl carrier protein-like protein [Artemisia annua]|uniref:Acyl carrier protein-like protein n=1 Tax=Artemisia annua TaxID=35608 RepID=A0A2U1KHR4_ARTAN|nr:Acyl carrier protein-like protein [Artemisia annua]
MSNPSSSSCCCISHEFEKTASKNPNKVAVIHSSPQHHHRRSTKLTTSSPLVYEADVCFNYSHILRALHSLTRRLRYILDDAHDEDPYLIKPSSSGLHSIDQSSNTPRIVGIYMVPSVEYIISVLSVLRCGEAFMPLDPSWPKERVLSVVASSAPSLILCGSTLFDGNCSDEIDKDHWLIDSGGCPVFVVSMKTILNENLASPSLLWPCGNKRARPFCYLMYTSGSTGTPKGVCGTEQGLLNRFLWMQDMYPLCGEESLLFKTSVGFIDHLQEILGALLTGCTLVIPSFSVLKENILSIPEYLQDYSINRLVAVPSLMRILLPTLQSSYNTTIQDSLKLLILSGEILHLSLWNSLTKLLPDTAILNLYGSTEVSGDCTYFDCKKLSAILESEAISTVPIGMPIPNCEVMLIGEDTSNCGEIYVSGSCTASGYFSHEIMPFKSVKNLPESSFCCSVDERESQLFFKTGDFAKQLPSGDLVYIGRNDRTVKVNGNRIALEEIEYTIRTHEDVLDAAVILNNAEGEVAYLEAFIVSKLGHDCVKGLSSSFRGWIVDKLPLAMIPKRLFFVETIPMSSSGKVDYKSLVDVTCSTSDVCSEIEEVPDGHFLQTIKEAFCDALVVEKISNNDDFFAMGGDSISAAHTSHKLGINMKLLYTFPTPLKLAMAFLDPKISRVDKEVLGWGPQHPNGSKGTDLEIIKPRGRLSGKLGEPDAEYHPKKVFKLDADLNIDDTSFAISRCNKVMFGDHYDISKSLQTTWFSDKKASIRKLWKVHMESCVDASPLVVVRGKDMFVGFVQWEVQLEGRVECSAAILGDFSELGVTKGTYIFSIPPVEASAGLSRQVKSQPVVDKQRHLVWCGSYDHNLYALDYQSYCCVYKLDCGGSIYGSPAINEVDERLYFPSTNGSMTALSLKANPFSMLWRQDMGAPIFGSLLIDRKNGNVICCLVNGHVVAVDAVGSIVWRAITGGPIFAGPCLSHVLNRQVIICSRDGGVYSFGLEKGNLLWKHDLGDPISSSAYVDENMQLTSNHSIVPDSSGIITLLRISLENVKETTPVEKHVVHEFARLDIQGAIFSSPLMIGGRIFVGCRDEYVHCHEIG